MCEIRYIMAVKSSETKENRTSTTPIWLNPSNETNMLFRPPPFVAWLLVPPLLQTVSERGITDTSQKKRNQ